MVKDAAILLGYILESIEFIEQYTNGLAYEDFSVHPERQDAVMKRIENIGEAVRNLPEEFKQAHGSMPWQDIVDMRNFLIHEYFGVDSQLLWDVVQRDLPPLKKLVADALHGK